MTKMTLKEYPEQWEDKHLAQKYPDGKVHIGVWEFGDLVQIYVNEGNRSFSVTKGGTISFNEAVRVLEIFFGGKLERN